MVITDTGPGGFRTLEVRTDSNDLRVFLTNDTSRPEESLYLWCRPTPEGGCRAASLRPIPRSITLQFRDQPESPWSVFDHLANQFPEFDIAISARDIVREAVEGARS